MIFEFNISREEFRKVLLKLVIGRYFSLLRIALLLLCYFIVASQFVLFEEDYSWLKLSIGFLIVLSLYILYFSSRYWLPLMEFNKNFDVSNVSFSVSEDANSLTFETEQNKKIVPWKDIIVISNSICRKNGK